MCAVSVAEQQCAECAEGGREGSAGLALVGGGVGFCIFTSVRKVEARFCAARTFLCFLVRDPQGRADFSLRGMDGVSVRDRLRK